MTTYWKINLGGLCRGTSVHKQYTIIPTQEEINELNDFILTHNQSNDNLIINSINSLIIDIGETYIILWFNQKYHCNILHDDIYSSKLFNNLFSINRALPIGNYSYSMVITKGLSY